MKILTLVFSILLFFGCNKNEFEICPCFEDSQAPFFKGCDQILEEAELYSCSQMVMLQTIYQNLIYPLEAIENCIQGRVVVKFEVLTSGSISGFRVENDTLGYGLKEATIEAAMTLSSIGFCPSLLDCNPIEYTYILPVTFRLEK